MKIAVTYENGQIFQHFGHTEQFKIYTVEDGKIVSSEVADTNGSGHGALAGFLSEQNVTVLICGGIGGGAQMALANAGIQLFGGVSGSCDDAVNALLANNLNFNPELRCYHHDHEHGEEGHTCGSHGCGSHNCGSHGCGNLKENTLKNQYQDKDTMFGELDEAVLPSALATIPSSVMNALYHQTKRMMGRMVDYKELRMIYACAMKEIKTKFDILNTEFNLKYHRNPINSIQTRLKSTASIIEKLAKLNMSVDIDSISENIHDIAGVRVICSYIDDVYLVAEALLKQDDITLVTRKDYIANPKENGYRSLHLIVKVPVFLSERRLEMEVEVQLRTIAMDFWASLEHQLHYKTDFDGKDELVDELRRCAETINQTDNDMMKIRSKMETLVDIPSEDEILFERIRKLDTPIE